MTINRRQLLARASVGVGGMALSPAMNSVFAAIKARADGTDDPPLRFVFLLKANGLWAEMIQPQGMEDRLPFRLEYDEHGRLLDGDHGNLRKTLTPAADLALGADVRLSAMMKPLEPFRHKISILQGIDSGFRVYHDGNYKTLGAFETRDREGKSEVLGPTIDSLLARAFPGPVPHVCLGHNPHAPSGVAYIRHSAEGPGRPVPYYTKPRRAYKELFGVVAQGEAKESYDSQSDILDFFVDDAKRLRSAVAGSEREQLDRYLDSFESVRHSRRELEAMSDRLRKFAPPPFDEIEAQATTKINAGNFEIAAAALASGLTNAVTIAFDTLYNSSYMSLGVGGLHGAVGHGQGGAVLEKRQKICGFQFEQMAKLATALDAIPEGNGTMLDNTVIVYTSNNGETHHSSGVNWPLVVLGDLGGRLATGRYFAPGNDPEDHTKKSYTRLGDVWATLLAAARQPYKDFGQPTNGVSHKPIEPLLAKSYLEQQ